MKKFGILLLSLCTATPALADFWTNCTTFGGTIVQANSYGNDKGGLCNNPNNPDVVNNCNGKRFCRGGTKMNWWSSFTWCESIGGKLVSFDTVCPGTQKNDSGTCPNLKNVGSTNDWCLTTLGWSNHKNIVVSLAGSISYSSPTQLNYGSFSFNALCEEK